MSELEREARSEKREDSDRESRIENREGGDRGSRIEDRGDWGGRGAAAGPPWVRHGPPPWTRRGDGAKYAEWGPQGEAWKTRDWREAPWHNEKARRGAQRWLLGILLRIGFAMALGMGAIALLIYLVVRLAGGATGTAVALWVATLLLLVLLPLVVLVTRRTWRSIGQPMAALVSAAEAVGRGDLSIRVPESSRNELLRFERTFNDMVAELERAETRRRTLTADIAHELRTPLQILQGNLEGVIDGVFAPTPVFLNDLLDETRLLARLVEDLRVLSQAEEGRLALEWEEVDVAALARDTAGGWLAHAAEKQVTLHVEVAEGDALLVRADWMRLTQALNNLLSNALRHVPPGGEVRVSVSALADGEAGALVGWVRLAVFNSGAAIADDALPYLFDRFWRGDKARTRLPAAGEPRPLSAATDEVRDAASAGSGLGLAIVRQLTEAMDGRVDVRNVAGGPGAAAGVEFSLELPRS